MFFSYYSQQVPSGVSIWTSKGAHMDTARFQLHRRALSEYQEMTSRPASSFLQDDLSVVGRYTPAIVSKIPKRLTSMSLALTLPTAATLMPLLLSNNSYHLQYINSENILRGHYVKQLSIINIGVNTMFT